MKKFNFIPIVAALIIGLFIGYRATMLNAQVTLVSKQLVAITAWGQTDVYVAALAGEEPV